MVRPRASARPWLLPPVNPRLSWLATSRTVGNSAAIIAALPSEEALSTTITSASRGSDARHARNSSRTFQLTTTIDNPVKSAMRG